MSKSAQTAANLVQEYNRLDDWAKSEAKRFNEHIKPANERMDEIKNILLTLLNSLGSKDKQSISTDYGTVYTSVHTTPKISQSGPNYVDQETGQTYTGRDAFLNFCLDHWDKSGNDMLLLRAPQVDAVKNYMDDNGGQLPPGVEISSITRVNIRRS